MTRTLSNGFTYEVAQNFFGGYNLYYKDSRMPEFKRSTKSFKSMYNARFGLLQHHGTLNFAHRRSR